jgi:hypothetical protein
MLNRFPKEKFKLVKCEGDEMYGNVVWYELYREMPAKNNWWPFTNFNYRWEFIKRSDNDTDLMNNAALYSIEFDETKQKDRRYPKIFCQ